MHGTQEANHTSNGTHRSRSRNSYSSSSNHSSHSGPLHYDFHCEETFTCKSRPNLGRFCFVLCSLNSLWTEHDFKLADCRSSVAQQQTHLNMPWPGCFGKARYVLLLFFVASFTLIEAYNTESSCPPERATAGSITSECQQSWLQKLQKLPYNSVVAHGWGQWKEYVLSHSKLSASTSTGCQVAATLQHLPTCKLLSCWWQLQHLQFFSHFFSTFWDSSTPLLLPTLSAKQMFHNSITTPSWAETGPGSICRNYSSGQSKRLALVRNSFNTMLAMEKISEYRIGLAQLWLCIPPFRQESCRPSWMTWWWLARPVTSCYTDKTWTNKKRLLKSPTVSIASTTSELPTPLGSSFIMFHLIF